MADDTSSRSRWFVRTLVGLTVLLCLGTAGYVGQVWWAKRVLHRWHSELAWVQLDRIARGPDQPPVVEVFCYGWPGFVSWINDWRECGWYGRIYSHQEHSTLDGYVPRDVYYEMMKSVTDQDFGNNPDAWEAWFQGHPNLVWDEKRKRLVEGPKP